MESQLEQVTGTPYLAKLYSRSWGFLQLAIDAGVEFAGRFSKAYLMEGPDL